MRKVLLFSGLGFLGLCGAVLAGAPPVAATAPAAGCHGQAVVAAEKGCHGLVLKVPAANQAAACHGRSAGRLTLSERSAARSMAKSNYRATLAAARSAGRSGDGITALTTEAPAMTMVPAAACGCPAGACKCK